ncbi:hypothetical protein BC834DRAFT_499106 [Gloeopeniophorella convolvens]|nr:hypothetical protein BC834DRAFT_499106 [Gloeopeniophorella convolvens]
MSGAPNDTIRSVLRMIRVAALEWRWHPTRFPGYQTPDLAHHDKLYDTERDSTYDSLGLCTPFVRLPCHGFAIIVASPSRPHPRGRHRRNRDRRIGAPLCIGAPHRHHETAAAYGSFWRDANRRRTRHGYCCWRWRTAPPRDVLVLWAQGGRWWRCRYATGRVHATCWWRGIRWEVRERSAAPTLQQWNHPGPTSRSSWGKARWPVRRWLPSQCCLRM